MSVLLSSGKKERERKKKNKDRQTNIRRDIAAALVAWKMQNRQKKEETNLA